MNISSLAIGEEYICHPQYIVLTDQSGFTILEDIFAQCVWNAQWDWYQVLMTDPKLGWCFMHRKHLLPYPRKRSFPFTAAVCVQVPLSTAPNREQYRPGRLRRLFLGYVCVLLPICNVSQSNRIFLVEELNVSKISYHCQPQPAGCGFRQSAWLSGSGTADVGSYNTNRVLWILWMIQICNKYIGLWWVADLHKFWSMLFAEEILITGGTGTRYQY